MTMSEMRKSPAMISKMCGIDDKHLVFPMRNGMAVIGKAR